MNENCITKCLSTNFSDCIFWSGANIETSCFTICKGTSLTDIIKDITDVVCEINQSGTCKINSSDLCLGYLEDKITSTDESITIDVQTDADGCKTLDLSVSNQNILLYSSWENVSASSDDLMSYLLSSGSLSTNGDELDIEGNFVWIEGEPIIRFYFDTSWYPIYLSEGALNSANVNVKLSRISDTEIRWRLIVRYYDTSGVLSGEQTQISSNLTVSDLDSNNIVIKFTNTTADSVTQQFMDVRIFKI